MVKVLIDGKEYEGKIVEVINFYGSTIDKESSDIKVWDKQKPKQEFVSVPKEIQFVQDCEEKVLGLRVGSHVLEMLKHIKDWEFRHMSELDFTDFEEYVDCVLVPVKREDLKAGDWAMSGNYDNLWFYYLVLGNDKYVRAQIDETNGVEVTELKITNGGNWFKVVPRSEAMK